MSKIETALAAIKAGTMSLYTAKQTLGADLTPAAEAELRAAHEAAMQGVCDHQDRMARATRGR